MTSRCQAARLGQLGRWLAPARPGWLAWPAQLGQPSSAMAWHVPGNSEAAGAQPASPARRRLVLASWPAWLAACWLAGHGQHRGQPASASLDAEGWSSDEAAPRLAHRGMPEPGGPPSR